MLLDASTLCRFAEQELLQQLRGYLGNRARITREVERELLRLSTRPELAQLADHLAKDGAVARTEGKWPKLTKNLPDDLKDEFARLLGLTRALGEHEREHAGEIATVLMAKQRGSDLVIMDDDWGSGLARRTYRLEVMSTARLTLEMVICGRLDEEEGFRVFDSATPDDVGRERFKAGLEKLRRD